jgi:ribosomal protein S18 acetylase RimI-like enzyme
MPTWEKFILKANEYMNNEAVSILGYFIENKLIGVIVIIELNNKTYEIKGIAVDSEYRKQGIGKHLIQYVCDNFPVSFLTVETDEDAIHFYKRGGFDSEPFARMGENGEYVRYKCVLRYIENT